MILPRYVIREHVGPFFMSLAIIIGLFVLNSLFRDLGKFLSKGIPVPVVLEVLFFSLGWMIALAVPCAVLCATIMAFGRLSADNEIVALKASGVSVRQILPLVLILSAVLTAALVWFNNNVLPDFNHRAKLLLIDIARKKPMLNLEPGVYYTELPNYNIFVRTIEDLDTLSHTTDIIIDDQTESNLVKTISARVGDLYFDQRTGMLEIILYDGEMQEVNIRNTGAFKKLKFRKHLLKIPMSETLLKRTEEGFRSEREKSSKALMESVRANEKRLLEKRKKLREKIDMHIKSYAQSIQVPRKTMKTIVMEHQRLARQIKSELNIMNTFEKQRSTLLVEVHKKYSIPVSCIVFALLGASLGVRIRNRGWAIAAGISLVFFVIYFLFLVGGEIIADRQIISPFLGMWSPNIVIGGLALVLTYRVTSRG